MAVIIRNLHLERKLRREAKSRGHKTLARTASELLTERFAQIQTLQPPRRPREAKAA